jgi:hypothetical protein
MLGRLLVPQSSTKPAVTAFLVGLAGAGAFVASLVLDWQRVTVTTGALSGSSVDGPSRKVVLTGALVGSESLGLVYVLGMLGMLTIVGSVLVKPESALRLRLGAAGLAVGLIGVVAAYTLNMPSNVLSPLYELINFEINAAVEENAELAYEPGLFAGFAAVVLLAASAWLAAAPAARAAVKWAAFAAENPGYAQHYAAYYYGAYQQPGPAAPPAAPAQSGNGAALAGQPVTATVPGESGPLSVPGYPPSASTYAPPPSSTWARHGHVDELTVTPAEPLDPGSSPDLWRG